MGRDRPVCGGSNLEKETKKWGREVCGLKGELRFLLLKMRCMLLCQGG